MERNNDVGAPRMKNWAGTKGGAGRPGENKMEKKLHPARHPVMIEK
jgi:hypothetical protein